MAVWNSHEVNIHFHVVFSKSCSFHLIIIGFKLLLVFKLESG